MTDDEIKKLAIDAKCWAIRGAEHGRSIDHNAGVIAMARMIEAAEREACAKVCEEWIAAHGDYFAEKIRERSNAPGKPTAANE